MRSFLIGWMLVLLCLQVAIMAEDIKVTDVDVKGAIDYGESSPVEYAGKALYSAVIFNGKGNDQVEITVTGNRSAQVALADGRLKQLATGTNSLRFTLPDHGQDPEAYYILVRDADGKPASFTVKLAKIQKAGA